VGWWKREKLCVRVGGKSESEVVLLCVRVRRKSESGVFLAVCDVELFVEYSVNQVIPINETVCK